MDFFDVNAMIGPSPFGRLPFESASELTCEMRRLGIRKAILYHSLSRQNSPAGGNEALAAQIEGHSELIGAMVLTPLIGREFGGRETVLANMRKWRVGAVRIFPFSHRFTLDPWNLEEIFALTEAYMIPVMIDMKPNEDDMAGYAKLFELAGAYPGTPIVMLSTGYRHLRVTLKLMEKRPNLHLDTSTFLSFRGIEEIVSQVGADRVLFGTRLPYLEGGVSVGRVLYADLSDADKRMIALGNAERLLAANRIFSGEEGGR